MLHPKSDQSQGAHRQKKQRQPLRHHDGARQLRTVVGRDLPLAAERVQQIAGDNGKVGLQPNHDSVTQGCAICVCIPQLRGDGNKTVAAASQRFSVLWKHADRPGIGQHHPQPVGKKLGALVEGARLAATELWTTAA